MSTTAESLTGMRAARVREGMPSAMRGKTVLIVEDESDLAELLAYNLEREGYVCRQARDGNAALAEACRPPVDLVLLDRMLPRLSGDEVAAQLKRDSRTVGIPIIMLTAKAEESDELVGFALGADDYVSKPFSMKLLLARVTAMFRRAEVTDAPRDVLNEGPIRLDMARHELTVHDVPVVLTATEFRLLRALMSADGRVLDRGRLIDEVMGSGVIVTTRTVDVHITALRRKLGDSAGWIHTLRGVGYAFRLPGAD
ncbi:MAG TPA: response regulator transcription factor [Phycisphaerae bacterium]